MHTVFLLEALFILFSVEVLNQGSGTHWDNGVKWEYDLY